MWPLTWNLVLTFGTRLLSLKQIEIGLKFSTHLDVTTFYFTPKFKQFFLGLRPTAKTYIHGFQQPFLHLPMLIDGAIKNSNEICTGWMSFLTPHHSESNEGNLPLSKTCFKSLKSLDSIVEHNVALDTWQVISETIFTANHSTGAKTSLSSQSIGWY